MIKDVRKLTVAKKSVKKLVERPPIFLTVSEKASKKQVERPLIKIAMQKGTPFQRAVWRVLQTIPYGEVRTYQWVAKKIGRPKAVRAVGNACGANPLPVIIPCHRVIASDGSLGGFSGGLRRKKRLLKREGFNF